MVAAREHHDPSERSLALELSKLHQKLDTLSMQVGHLYERTLALEELKNELMPIARDAMRALAAELSEVEHELNTELLAELLRKLVRSTPALIRYLDRLESLDGFITEVEPLGKHIVRETIDQLQVFEERGYFRLLTGMLEILDRVATHATQEDVDRLVENVTTMVDTVKRATQPELLAKTNKALTALDPKAGRASRVGLWGLVRATREPEIQEGLGLMLEIMRQLGKRNGHAAGDHGETDTSAKE